MQKTPGHKLSLRLASAVGSSISQVHTSATAVSEREKVLFIYRTHLLKEGEHGPKDFLWGSEWLDRSKYDVSFINVPRRERRSGFRLLFWLPDWLFARKTRIGLPLEIYPMFRLEILSARHIVCVNDQISLAMLFWRFAGRLKNQKLHCVIMSLPERVKNPSFSSLGRRVSFELVRRADSVLTLSDSVHHEFKHVFQVDPRKIRSIYFGVDTDFWVPSEQTRPGHRSFVLAIGNDLNRDYSTLIRAIPDEIALKIITQQKLGNEELWQKPNIEILNQWLSNREVRALYQQATFVVIPVKKVSSESTGLSTILQAMACGTPVLTADGRTIRELFEDSEACMFYEAENERSLRSNIIGLWENKDKSAQIGSHGLDLVRRTYSSQQLAGRLSDVIRSSPGANAV